MLTRLQTTIILALAFATQEGKLISLNWLANALGHVGVPELQTA